MADDTYPELASGDQGPWVEYLQQLLDHTGYWTGMRPFHADGVFDETTAESVRRFQVAHGLGASGAVDQATWEGLEQVADDPPAQPTPAPYGGAPGHGGGGTDPLARSAMGPLGNLVLFGPSPFMFFSIIGLIGGLAERQERREREAAALEALRDTGDEYRRWTLAKAATNVLQDFLVSSDADGVSYTTGEATRIQTIGNDLVDLLHENDWVASTSEIGVAEGWLGNIPEDVWEQLSDRVTRMWDDLIDALRSGTPAQQQGPDVAHGAVDVDATEVHQLFFSTTNHSEYYVKGR